MIIRSVRGKTPKYADSCFLAENAALIGDVEIGEESSIWYNATLRGDVAEIRIGKQTNIQDGTVIHGSYNYSKTIVHDRVTVGHQVTLHGCEIKSGSLIGMGSTILDNVVIGEHCLVAAGSLVLEGAVFPAGQMIMGRPAKVKRPLTADEIAQLEESADHYLEYMSWYKNGGNNG